MILGYRLHLDFEPPWRALAEAYFLFNNWHLLWYAVVALAVIGARRLVRPPLAPLAAVVGTGLVFLRRRLHLHQRRRVGRRLHHRQPGDAPSRAPAGSPLRVALARAIAGAARASAEHPRSSPPMRDLPGVTLCCIDTANPALALRALRRSTLGHPFRAHVASDRPRAGGAGHRRAHHRPARLARGVFRLCLEDPLQLRGHGACAVDAMGRFRRQPRRMAGRISRLRLPRREVVLG